MTSTYRRRRAHAGALVLLLALLGLLVAVTAGGQGPPPPKHLVAKKPARPNAGPPLPPGQSRAAQEKKRRGYLVPSERAYAAAKGLDASFAQRGSTSSSGAVPSLVPSTQVGWQGLSDNSLSPGDSTGAIGTSRYIELVNSKYGIYNRSGVLQESGTLSNLTGDFAGSLGDPQIMWDPGTNRFYYVVDNFDTNFINVGFSKTATPSSQADFCKYNLDFGYGSELPDYPKLGDTRDFLLIGVNVFTSGGFYDGSDTAWVAKPPLGATCPSSLGIGTKILLEDSAGNPAFTPVPANQTDTGDIGWVVSANSYFGNNALHVFRVTTNPDNTPNIDQVGTKVSGAAAWSFPANATQLGTSATLDTLDSRLTQAVSAIDPSKGTVAIWTQHTIAGGGGSQVRWYEVAPISRTLFQSGSVAGSTFVFNGAISPDRVVNGSTTKFGSSALIGFNTSSSSTRPAIQMVSKVAGEAQSAFIPEQTSASSLIDFTCGSPPCRWGDYAAAAPDPAANTSAKSGQVWFTSEFVSGGKWSSWNWSANLQLPGITSFTPTSGPVGQLVTLTGTALTGTTEVTFGGTPATTFTVVSDTSIQATVPSGATTGPIQVTTPLGVFPTATAFKVTPKVTGYLPASAPRGTSVIISGSNFTGATSVKFGAVAATTVSVDNDGQITATVPATAVTGKITVTTQSGSGVSATNFVVILPPVVSSFTPASGPVGTLVTVSGANLDSVTSATLGLVDVGALTHVGSTQLKFNVPATATTGKIAVTNPAATVQSVANFVVTPKVTGFLPVSGQRNSSVTISGSNFTGVTKVLFGSVSASFSFVDDGQITATVPVTAVTGKITVTTPSGSGVSASSFVVILPPVVSSFAPASGPVGTLVTVSGSNLDSVTSATLNLVDVGALTHVGSTQLKFNVPATATTGKIAVTNAAATVQSATNFSVTPKVTGYDVVAAAVGDPVTINGTSLTGATVVKFNGVAAVIGSIAPDGTSIDTTVPTGAFTGPVTVTTAGGTATGPAFKVLPVISSLSVSSGTVGTLVTINGSTFNGTTSVKFNNVAAAISLVTPTQVKATVPATATTGAVTLTTAGGTASGGTFNVLPKVTSFSPTSGPSGAVVTVNGSGFFGSPTVTFNGIASSTVTIITPTSLKATVPGGATTGPIQVVTAEGPASSATNFTVTFTIASFSPTVARTGDIVAINGNGLLGTTAVKFNGISVAPGQFVLNAAGTQITAEVPSGDTTGKITVQKTVSGVTSSTSSATNFTLFTVSGFSPPSASVGDTVTISGSGLSTANLVTFGGGNTAIPSIVDDSSITAVVPAGATTGTLKVRIATGATVSTTDSLTLGASVDINEVAPNVAGNADLVELRVTSGGTLSGIKLVENPAGLTPVTLATLPAVTVSSGDVIVVHLNAPTGVTGETSSKTQCFDSACYAGAWDVVGGSAGVDFGNTVLVGVGASGRMQDGIPFTDTSAAPLSFLSELLALQAAGLWLPVTCGGSACTYGTSPSAQDVSVDWSSVGTTPSGASVGRTANADTNAKADWAVGAGQSLGAANP